jgi:hypothetical protein
MAFRDIEVLPSVTVVLPARKKLGFWKCKGPLECRLAHFIVAFHTPEGETFEYPRAGGMPHCAPRG